MTLAGVLAERRRLARFDSASESVEEALNAIEAEPDFTLRDRAANLISELETEPQGASQISKGFFDGSRNAARRIHELLEGKA